MKESNLWDWLTKARDHLTNLHITRVEDGLSVGRPDVEGWWGKHGGFAIELKVAPRPVRRTTPIRAQHPPTKEQVEWLRTRREAGGNAYILVQVGERAAARRYLLDGFLAQEVLDGRTEDWYEDHAAVDPTNGPAELVASASMGHGLY
jgi:hypothetical protein